MLARTARARDDGFTLIELLVVVLVIGVLAAIAIPVFVGQTGSAHDAATRADLQDARIAMKSYVSEHAGTPTVDTAALEAYGWTTSPGVALSIERIGPGAGEFCIDGSSDSTHSPYRVSDSAGVEAGSC